MALHEKSSKTRVVVAVPPDVRYRLKAQEPILKLDFINSGFAAGCEARLCLAVSERKQMGSAPRMAFGP